MRFIAEIQLHHPELVLTETLRRSPGMDVELEYQLIGGADSYILLFQVRGDDFETFESALDDDPTVSEAARMITTDHFRIYRCRLRSTEYLVLARGVELGLRLLETTGTEAGWYATLEVPEMETLQRFQEYCEQKGVTLSIQKLYHTEETGYVGAYGLTPQQRDAIITAHEAGYFNEPRDTSLTGVAATLGVSPSAANGRLRRGLRNLIRMTVLADTSHKK